MGTPAPHDDLTRLDATDIAARVRSRQVTARHTVEETLRRIAAIDHEINAYRVVMAAEALAEAVRIDALPDADLADLPLAGVPVAVKDDTDVAGHSTMWGTAVDRGVGDRDADVIGRLRLAGAIIVGKTNVPELTLWPWTASETWGVTRNPWDVARTPGGSSGGSAAAVCSGMAAIALGSDGGGSIRYPAGLTGLVGVKPQRDRLAVGPEHGSGWNGLVVLGPLTRSVRDAALFLDVASANSTNLSDSIADAGSPLRIAVSVNPPIGTNVSLHSARRRDVSDIATVLAELGHHVTNVDIDYGLSSLWTSTVRLLKGVQLDVDPFSDDDGIETRTRNVARLGRLIPSRSLRAAVRNEQRIAASINRVFDDADVVLTPLCGSPAPRIADCPSGGALRSLRAANTSAWLVPWNLIGQPAMTVPTGIGDDGLPTAIHLAGRAHDEATLLAVAAQIEAARPQPRPAGPAERDPASVDATVPGGRDGITQRARTPRAVRPRP